MLLGVLRCEPRLGCAPCPAAAEDLPFLECQHRVGETLRLEEQKGSA